MKQHEHFIYILKNQYNKLNLVKQILLKEEGTTDDF